MRRNRCNTRGELIHAIGRSIRNINKDGRADGVRRLPNNWKKVINEGAITLKVHKCCTPVNKAMSEISNFAIILYPTLVQMYKKKPYCPLSLGTSPLLTLKKTWIIMVFKHNKYEFWDFGHVYRVSGPLCTVMILYSLLKLINKYTPAVTKVGQWTTAETGVGAAHMEPTIWTECMWGRNGITHSLCTETYYHLWSASYSG